MPDWWVLGIAAAGVVITAILLWGTMASSGLPYCSAGAGCDVVQSSAWSHFLGAPLALWGLLSYVGLGLVALTGTQSRRRRALAVLATAGFGISLYLTVISFVVIEAQCPYCLFSAALMTAAFALSLRDATPGFGSHGLGAALALLLATGMHVQATGGLHAAGAPDPYLRALAAHLTAQGARFYGASWCPHCQQQKALFGAAAVGLPYVECSPNGQRAPRATSCEMAEIRNYPTWIIAGRHIERVLQASDLAAMTGFAPAASTGQ